MNFKLKRIAPLQAGKMLAALYGLLSLVFVPFMLVAMAFGRMAAHGQGSAGTLQLPLMFGLGLGFVVVLPLLYALMGFLAGVIGAWVYNLLAGWLGGFEFDLETPSAPLAAPLS